MTRWPHKRLYSVLSDVTGRGGMESTAEQARRAARKAAGSVDTRPTKRRLKQAAKRASAGVAEADAAPKDARVRAAFGEPPGGPDHWLLAEQKATMAPPVDASFEPMTDPGAMADFAMGRGPLARSSPSDDSIAHADDWATGVADPPADDGPAATADAWAREVGPPADAGPAAHADEWLLGGDWP